MLGEELNQGLDKSIRKGKTLLQRLRTRRRKRSRDWGKATNTSNRNPGQQYGNSRCKSASPVKQASDSIITVKERGKREP